MRDTGQYGCTAGNRGGFNRTEVSLVVGSSKDFVPSYNLSGDSGDETMSTTIGITLGAAGIYMLLVLSLMLYCRVRRARRKAALLGSRSKGQFESRIDSRTLFSSCNWIFRSDSRFRKAYENSILLQEAVQMKRTDSMVL